MWRSPPRGCRVDVRHNTTLLEEAVAHIVRRAAIPTIEAEAAALHKRSRALAHRRLATGAAIALAAVGIGLGVFFGTRSRSPHIVVAAKEDAKGPPPAKMPDRAPERVPSPAPIANPAPSANQPATHAPITTKYTLFNEEDVTLLGKTWRLEAGHFFADATQKSWEYAWCHTSMLVDGVEIRVELVYRASPDAYSCRSNCRR